MSCRECGGNGYWTRYMPCAEKEKMEAYGICFPCAFWLVKIDEGPHRTVIDGVLFHVGDAPQGTRFAGYAGRRFDIEYFDGQRVTTYDLWCQGEIPERYRDRLPNTANFQKQNRANSLIE